MKKLPILLILCLLLVWVFPLSTAAAPAHVVDNAGLLTATEAQILEEMCQDIRREHGMDMVILTVDSLNGKTAQNYADDYYDFNGYGPDGVLMLLAMSDREWHISTSGSAIKSLSDDDLTHLEDLFLSYFSDGDYYGGFYIFLDHVPRYFGEDTTLHIYWPFTFIVSAILAGIILLIMRSTMNTKTAQRAAGSYLTEGSYQLKTVQDLFLYSNVSKVRRQQNNSSSGGSSTHRSSSGRSHGGRGGKF